jgi:hypothetical protein
MVLSDDSVLAGLLGFLTAKAAACHPPTSAKPAWKMSLSAWWAKSMKDVENGAAD